MKSVDLTIKWKVNHILECVHTNILKNNLNIVSDLNITNAQVNKTTGNYLSSNFHDDEIDNDWIYDSDEFPLMFDKYTKYEEVTVNNNLIINSNLSSYIALPNHIKYSKKCSDYIVIMKNNYVIKCIKSSNVNSIIDAANVITYYFNEMGIGSFENVKATDNIYILVCKRE